MTTNQTAQATSLRSFVEDLTEYSLKPLNYESLCEWVESRDWLAMEWESLLPKMDDPEDYARNILCLEPFEVVLIQWPPGVESAVHHHEGFWGAVVCLKGILENVSYSLKTGQLRTTEIIRATERGIVAEPDGTLHKIKNGSNSDPLVTLHFYSPALANLDGLVLYDLPTGNRLTCNSLAPTASVDLDRTYYREVEPNAFEYVAPDAASHFHCNVVPKPSPKDIEQMVSAYYAEHASVYDNQDLQVLKRNRYTAAIDARIVQCLMDLNKEKPVSKGDALCLRNRKARSLDTPVGSTPLCDAWSGFMCGDGGAGRWGEDFASQVTSLIDIEPDQARQDFDVITLLYAYGHLPNRSIRKHVLHVAHQMLRPGGQLIFDVFDISDPGEWGPDSVRQFKEQRLAAQGYEEGDVFYKRSNGDELAFMHYCDRNRLEEFVLSAGFDAVEMTTIGYDQNPGKEASSGKLFVVATKL